MSRLDDQDSDMSLDDSEELFPDKPRDGKWELIGGPAIASMTGARWEPHVLVERDEPLIAIFDRAGAAWFTQRLGEGFGATLDLAALDRSIPLAEIHRDVLSA